MKVRKSPAAGSDPQGSSIAVRKHTCWATRAVGVGAQINVYTRHWKKFARNFFKWVYFLYLTYVFVTMYY